MAKPQSFGIEFGLLVRRRRAERGLSQTKLAAILWPDSPDPENRKPEISRLESGRVDNPQESTILSFCEALGIREDEVNALRLHPALDAKMLEKLGTTTRAELRAIARNFGLVEVETASTEKLREFLTNQAEKFRAYHIQIEALDGHAATIGNLKGAAQDAANRFDFEEVENLLSRVHEIDLDVAAQTSEARAANALLRGRPEQAYTVLAAAADSFNVIDPLEPARRKLKYAHMFVQHGERYGGNAFQLSDKMLDAARTSLSEDAHPEIWFESVHQRAITQAARGISIGGTDGRTLIESAITDYLEALSYYNATEFPLQRAKVLQNLTLARASLFNQTGSKRHFHEAQSSNDAAMRLFKETRQDLDWVGSLMTRSDLMFTRGNFIRGPSALQWFVAAAECCELALGVLTQADHPVEWALAHSKLGTARSELASRTDGPEVVPLLGLAEQNFRDALKVRTPSKFPIQWAATQNALGICLQRQGGLTAGRAGLRKLEESENVYKELLEVSTESDQPYAWARLIPFAPAPPHLVP